MKNDNPTVISTNGDDLKNESPMLCTVGMVLLRIYTLLGMDLLDILSDNCNVSNWMWMNNNLVDEKRMTNEQS